MSTITPEQLSALLSSMGLVVGEPIEAAPTASAAYGVVSTVKSTERNLPAIIAEAMNAAEDGKRLKIGRFAAAYHKVPHFSCDADAQTLFGPAGNVLTGHGQITERKAGEPCPTKGCTGKIRA